MATELGLGVLDFDFDFGLGGGGVRVDDDDAGDVDDGDGEEEEEERLACMVQERRTFPPSTCSSPYAERSRVAEHVPHLKHVRWTAFPPRRINL